MQVVAITVFFLLSVAFYAFFAPFLGKDIYEYIAIGIYSSLVSVIWSSIFFWNCKMFSALNCATFFQALSVFILYVRCTAIDPADPGILIEADKMSPYTSHVGTELTGKSLEQRNIRNILAFGLFSMTTLLV